MGERHGLTFNRAVFGTDRRDFPREGHDHITRNIVLDTEH